MTEEEWCGRYNGDNSGVVRAVRELSERKQRLLACACCELVKQACPVPEVDEVIQAAERYIETGRSKAALRRLRQRMVAEAVRVFAEGRIDRFFAYNLLSETVSDTKVIHALYLAAASLGNCLSRISGSDSRVSNRQTYPLYHDLVATSAVEPSWRTATVTALASGIYNDGAFDRLPILADALEEAGCTSADMLGHCRGPALHIRGCWAVDLLLGKE